MKKIDDIEYKALRDELNMRIQLMNTHNIGMITAVFAVWALAGALVNEYVKIFSEAIDLAITLFTLFVPLLIILPIAIILPLSVKSGDNIGQTMSLSAYIRVHAEMPRFLLNENEFIGWESLQKKEMERKLSDVFFNSEYTILSSLSICMFIIVSAVMTYYGLSAGYNDIYYIIPIFILLIALGITAMIFIFRKSSSSLFLKRRDAYYKRYCDFAVQSGMLTQKEIDDYNNFIRGL